MTTCSLLWDLREGAVKVVCVQVGPDLGTTEDANKMTGSTLLTAVRRARRSHSHARFVL